MVGVQPSRGRAALLYDDGIRCHRRHKGSHRLSITQVDCVVCETVELADHALLVPQHVALRPKKVRLHIVIHTVHCPS